MLSLITRWAVPLTVAVALALVAALTVALDQGAAHAAGAVRWSSPATWGGKVPVAGQTVRIPAGKTVVLDVSPPKLAGLQIDGTLRFADRNLRLHTGWIMVHGTLQIGSTASPHSARAEIVLDGNPNADVMGMGANVLGVMGGRLELHGKPRPVRWTRLAATVQAGSNRVRVQSAKGWRRGDRIVIAATSNNPDEAEERTISRVDGRVLTLNHPLAHTHWGRAERIAGTTVAQRAEVGLLSRNIVIRGPAGSVRSGIGGHVMVMHGSTARVSDVELVHMGQAGRLARYPFHFHMMGSAPGSYFRSSVVRDSHSRCVTVHGTSDVTVADNVGYATRGHCFFFEDGAETGVKLLRNLGLSTRRPLDGKALLDSDNAPASFWITHPSNVVRGNAAAGSEGNGFWYDLPEHPTGLSADPQINNRVAEFGEFVNNVAHSNVSRANQFRSGSGLLLEDYRAEGPAVVRNFRAYKNSGFGIWAEHSARVVGATLAENNVGFLGRGAVALRESTIVGATANNADKHWSMTGVGLYHDTTDISRVTFANFKPDQWRHGVAIGPIVEDITTVPRFSSVRFVNADRVRMTPPWIDDRVSATMITDVDGSVTGSGTGRTITASHPLLLGPGCRRSAALDAHLCPKGARITMVRVQDHTGARQKIGPASLTRDDGARYAVPADHSWSSQPMSQGTVLMNRRYTMQLGRPTPANLEWVVSNAETGWVQLAVKWPHANAFVYDGWGEWARNLKPAASQSELAQGARYWLDPATKLLHVRFSNDGAWRWLRIKACAQRHCGEGLGTRGHS